MGGKQQKRKEIKHHFEDEYKGKNQNNSQNFVSLSLVKEKRICNTRKEKENDRT